MTFITAEKGCFLGENGAAENAPLPSISPEARVARLSGLPFAEGFQTSNWKSGRRDWIRTNDPHHVKVVL